MISEFVLSVNRKKVDLAEDYEKFLVFSLKLLELTATQKTFTLETTVRLGAVNMQHHRPGHTIINMIETPDVEVPTTQTETLSQYLFTVTYTNVSISFLKLNYKIFYFDSNEICKITVLLKRRLKNF